VAPQLGRPRQERSLEAGAVVGGQGEGPLHVLDPLVRVAVEDPQPRQRRRQPAPTLRLRGREAPDEGGTEVVVLGLQPLQPGVLVAQVELGLGLLREREKMVEVTVVAGCRLPGLPQPVACILSDRLQQPVPRLAVGLVGRDQRLVDQAAYGDEHVVPGRARADRVGGIEGEVPREHGQLPEQHAVGLVQQVVAPLDRGLQCLLAGGDTPRAAGQQPEAVVQTRRDLRGRQRPHPGGGQLDGQRDPVESLADGVDGVSVAVVDDEPGHDVVGPVREQADRLGLDHRRHPPDGLAGHAERLAAGGQHRHLRAGAQQRVHQLGGGVDHVLAVVQADQQPPIPEVHGQRPQGPAGGLDHHPGAGRHQLGHPRGIGHRAQIDPPDAVRPPVRQARSRLHRQAGLAAAARARERDKLMTPEQPLHDGQLATPADEARDLQREVVGQCIEGPQRRELARELLEAQLEDPLRARQVPQPVGPQVDQPGAGRRRVGNERRGHRRQQRLSAVRDIAYASAAAERRPAVVLVLAGLGLPGVDPQPQPCPDGSVRASPVRVSWIWCAAATASAADSNTATAPAPWPRRSSRVPL
jgi:hypothetical protein